MVILEKTSAQAPGGLPAALKPFSDPTRLRILGLLEQDELSVGELSRALALSQSRVSNHLRVLRDASLLRERHSGTSTYLRLESGHPDTLAARLWQTLRSDALALPEHDADRARLEALRREQRVGQAALFDRLAPKWDKIAGAFETGQARERAAVHLLPRDTVVADLGCGTGYMGHALLGNCARLISVDRSEKMLAEARSRLESIARDTQLEFRRGDLDRLPLTDGEVDGVLVGMVLHHLEDLGPGLHEILRVLRPGGTVAILELAPHREAWMRDQLGDRHLGLQPADVLAALRRAGFVDLVLDPVEDRYRPRRSDAAPDDESVSLSLYVVRGRKPRL